MATQPPAEPLSYETVKDYLRLLDDVEQVKIEAMIPRARLWVEEHTGLALIQREFKELHTPRSGVVRLYRGPLVAVGSVGYSNGDGDQTFDATAYPPSTKLTGAWPPTGGEPFQITYTAGYAEGEPLDDRLLGAMLALIEGEYSEGYAYSPDTITGATNCLFYMKFVAP
jgi:uncharacterized phiE125 gp8 family phage protein